MASQEEELRKTLVMIELYKKELEELNKQQQAILLSITELNSTIDALKSLEEEKQTSTLIPIGSNSYLYGNIKELNKVLVEIGADVYVETTTQEAKEILNKRVEKAREVLTKIKERANYITMQLQELAPKAQKMLEEQNARKTAE